MVDLDDIPDEPSIEPQSISVENAVFVLLGVLCTVGVIAHLVSLLG